MMRSRLLLIGLLCSVMGKPVFAVPVAADDSSSAAYSAESGGAWKGLEPTVNENPPGMDNGGYGFLPWNFAGGYHDATASPYGNLNHFIDGVDFSASSWNDLGGPAFGLTNGNSTVAGFTYTARATRVFSEPLAVGGTFRVEFDNPVLSPPNEFDTTGYILRLNSGGGAKIGANPDVRERLGFFASHGFNQGDWNRTDSEGVRSSGLNSTATTSGAEFQVTLPTAESYLLEILPLGGGGALYSATGNLASPGAGSIDTLEIVMFGNGSGNGLTGSGALPTGQREFFFDNLLLDNPPMLLAGDYNRNGAVDAADYVIWRKNDGTQQGYNNWRSNFGRAAGSGTALPSAQSLSDAVPEPATLMMFVVAIMSIFTCQRVSVS